MGPTLNTPRLFLLLVPSMLFLCSSFPGQASAAPLTLSQVVEYSLRNNGELSSFREEKGVHEAGKARAGLLPNPMLELDAGTGALTGSSAENSLSLGISQEFVLGGKRHKRMSVAERAIEAYGWQLTDRERLIRREVKMAFHDLLLAEEKVALTGRLIELNRQLFDVAKERLAAGDIPELEMNLVKVELARSEGARIVMAKTLNQNQSRLSTLMGLPVEERAAISGRLESAAALSLSMADLKQLVPKTRPDLRALEAEVGRGDADLALAEAERIPNFSVGFAVTREATSIEVGEIEAKDTDYMVGLKLSLAIPIFDVSPAGVQEARAKRSSAASRLIAARRSVEREVEIAYASYQDSEKVLSLYSADVLPQLEENLNLTREAYRLGELGILAVIEEQKKFFEVSDAYLTALHDRQVALAELEAAVATEITGGAQ